jgi:hypothetical protein
MHGYHSLESLRLEPAFTLLKRRPDFQLVLYDAAFPIDPFRPPVKLPYWAHDPGRVQGLP